MNTKQKILNYIEINNMVRPNEIIEEFGISNAMVHRHLKKLLSNNSIKKVGKPPKVYYVATDSISILPTVSNIPDELTHIIEKTWLYINPDGVVMRGLDGFIFWANITKQNQNLQKLAQEYVLYRKKTDKLKNNINLISASKKMDDTFTDVYLDEVFYQDFYSLPKFGKTKLGNMVYQAKQSQSLSLISELSIIIKPVIIDLLKSYKIDAIGYIPHSIKRYISFLPTLKNKINIEFPEIEINKAYSGDVAIAQKSLRKLEERINNAKNTIFINRKKDFPKRILLIDDAVGSGATLNETAEKLKKYFGVKHVIGFSIVGSMNGFPVITEI